MERQCSIMAEGVSPGVKLLLSIILYNNKAYFTDLFTSLNKLFYVFTTLSAIS